MSGLTHSSDLGASGLSGGWRLFRLTATNSAWGIPSHAAMLYIEVIGGGAAGCGGWAADQPGRDVADGGGGGGGAMAWGMYSVASLKTAGITALAVTVAAQATSSPGSSLTPSDGTDGNTSSVIGTATTSGYGNMALRAYGGGGGMAATTNGGVGGGGGGTGSSGAKGSTASNTHGVAGKPYVAGHMDGGEVFAIGGGGGAGADNTGGNLASAGKSAEYGGGGGGSANNSTAGGSIFGAGGGGGSGAWYIASSGGAWNNYTQGGTSNGFDRNGAVSEGESATHGTSRTYGCGDGGAGYHGYAADHAAEIGGDGGTPGGGGGASGTNSTGHVRGGHGARGEVRIWAI